MSNAKIVNELNAQARAVGIAHDSYEGALADKRMAQAELLRSVVEAITPALRALCSRIVTAMVRSAGGKTDACAIGVPGLFVASDGPAQTLDRPGPILKAGRSWEGRDLFLLQDATWVLLAYDGADDGKISEWSSVPVELTDQDVLDVFPLDVILDAIARALAKQADGNKLKRTKEIEARAGRIRALVTLVRASL